MIFNQKVLQRTMVAWVGAGVCCLFALSSNAANCSYKVVSEWSSGFVANVKIINDTSTPINGWEVTWAYTDGTTRTGGWNAEISGNNPYTAKSLSWNSIIQPGQSIEFGLQGSKPDGKPAQKPALTGAVCASLSSSSAPSSSSKSSRSVPSSTPSSSSEPSSSSSSSNCLEGCDRVDNPFAAAKKWYIDPIWSAKAVAEPSAGAKAISKFSTAVWMDRIGAIAEPPAGVPGLGLRGHLDAALMQGADLFTFVVYNLPIRDCAALASNGELTWDGTTAPLDRYKQEFIGGITKILSDPLYKSIKIVAIIEVDSLPNLITNVTSAPKCALAASSGFYREGVTYALNELAKLDNVYSYIDIAHSGWVGWSSNFGPVVTLINGVVRDTEKGWNSVAGFLSNAANYIPVEEPFLPDPTLHIGGNPIRSADFYEWNDYFEEKSYVLDFRKALIAKGAPETIGMLIDTSRNGWGGPNRPTKESTSADKNTYVNESRIDRRFHRGNWCNQAGGVGFKPWANPYPGIDAFVWVKPQGESDGISDPNFAIDPQDPAKRHDPMCDPLANNTYKPSVKTGALPGAPHAGRWFPLAIQTLVANAYPAATDPAGPPPPPTERPKDCPGTSGKPPIELMDRNKNLVIDLKCGAVYLSFPSPISGLQFDNTGSEMNISVEYNGLTKSSGKQYSWNTGISGTINGTMKINRIEGGANSVKIMWY